MSEDAHGGKKRRWPEIRESWRKNTPCIHGHRAEHEHYWELALRLRTLGTILGIDDDFRDMDEAEEKIDEMKAALDLVRMNRNEKDAILQIQREEIQKLRAALEEKAFDASKATTEWCAWHVARSILTDLGYEPDNEDIARNAEIMIEQTRASMKSAKKYLEDMGEVERRRAGLTTCPHGVAHKPEDAPDCERCSGPKPPEVVCPHGVSHLASEYPDCAACAPAIAEHKKMVRGEPHSYIGHACSDWPAPCRHKAQPAPATWTFENGSKVEFVPPVEAPCECGAASTNEPHARWCPKHE